MTTVPDQALAAGAHWERSGLARALFEQSPFSSVIYDPAGHPIALNAAFRAMWGVGIETVPPGYTVLEDAELERRGALASVRRAFAGEVVVTPPVRYDIARVSATGEGRAIWTQGYFFPVRDEAGVLTHVVLTHIDLTAQKEAEEALRASEERMRIAQQVAQIGVFDWHVPSGRVTWTPEEERLFGLEPGTFEGTVEAWGRRVLPDDLARLQRDVADHMARRESEMTFAFRIRRPDGEMRRIEGRAAFVYADDGSPIRMVGVNVDVTERTRLDAALRESEAQLRETQRIARVGSWGWDVATNRLTWSDVLCELYGVPIDSPPADFQEYLGLVHPDDRDLARAIVERALAGGDSFAFDHRVVWPDGTVRRLHGRGRVIRDRERNIVRMVGSSIDVTDQWLATVALEEARSRAEEANRAKTEFLTTMSHELRTPLNAIAGYAGLLEMGVRGAVTDEQREDLHRIQKSQQHLLGLINEVLNYARLESGMVTYDIRPTLVADVVSGAAQLVEPQRTAKNLRLEVRLPEFAGGSPVHVLADPEKLQQVLLNLLSNAVKFTPDGGLIAVEVVDAPNDQRVAVLRVSDTGVGIPRDKLEAIFEPFVQIGRSLSSPGEGTGLGLAISRDLARGMGGDLTVESTVGQGSAFTLTLPLA